MAEPTPEQINRVVTAYNRAVGAAEYTNTLVVQAEQISGDEYRMNWSNRYDGSFVPDAGS